MPSGPAVPASASVPAPVGPPEWPWPRLLLLALGSGLAMVGTYVILFRLFEVGFQIADPPTHDPLLWGGLALVAGVLMLGAPWFPNAPWWKDEEREKDGRNE